MTAVDHYAPDDPATLRHVTPEEARRRFRTGVRREGIALLLRLGPLRLVVARPEPSGVGNLAMDILMVLHVARALGASLHLVREGAPVNRVVFELKGRDVRLVGRWSPLGLLARILWSAVELRRFWGCVARERRAQPQISVYRTRKERVADVLGAASARFHRERAAEAGAANYLGLDLRSLYAHRPIEVHLPRRLERRARKTAAALGIAPSDRLVCLHVRESGFNQARGVEEHPGKLVRNARVETYLPAIDELVRLGYTVVRIGDPSMTRLERRGVIDLATSPLRTDALELWCLLRCEFIIAGDSGPQQLAWLLNIPCLAVNVVSILRAYPLLPHHMYIPKHVVERETGREVPLSRLVDPGFQPDLSEAVKNPKAARLAFVDNSKDDIVDAVRDMLRLLADGPPETPEQAEYRRLVLAERFAPASVRAWEEAFSIPPHFLGAGRIAPSYAAKFLHEASIRGASG